MGGNLERNIAEGLADCLDLLRVRLHGGYVTASGPVIATHVGPYPAESSLIVERRGQDFGLPDTPFDPPEFGQHEQGIAKVEADVDGLLPRLASLGQMGQCRQRVLEVPERFPVG